jgi:GNAT superfamily N-acetyltransferase
VISTAKKKYFFQKENFNRTLRESIKLFLENHRETSFTPDVILYPDFVKYSELEVAGQLEFMTIRFQGDLVGYAIFFIEEEIRHKGLMNAIQDALYISKAHRGIGLQFIKFCDEILVQREVNCIWRQSTSKLKIGKVYERLGYEHVQNTYLRRI